MQIRGQENPWRRGFLEPQPVKCVPWLLTMDTSYCTYHCNQTSSPASQSNKRKVAPRKIKKPLAVVPLPAIYVLSKNSPCSLNIQVKLTSLTSLTSLTHICAPRLQSYWYVHKPELCAETPAWDHSTSPTHPCMQCRQLPE